MLVSQNPLDIIMTLSFKERASVGMVRTMDMSVVGIINIVVSRVKSWFYDYWEFGKPHSMLRDNI